MEIKLTEELGQTRIQVRQEQANNISAAGITLTILILAGLAWLIHYFWGQFTATQHKDYIPFMAVAALFFLGLSYALYDIACRHFNTVEVIINEKGEFLMRQRPIPRPGIGAIPRKRIKQFYIRRHLNQVDSRKVQHLTLSLRLTNGITKSLFFDKATNYNALRELETMIEERLGIVEAPTKGEFRPGVLANSKTPRPIARPFRNAVDTSGNASNKRVVQLGELEWDILFRKQYDWNNKQTDELLTVGYGLQRKHLYLEASGESYELQSLALSRQLEFGIHVKDGALSFASEQLRLLQHKTGQVFRALQQHQPGIACQSYTLASRQQPGRIRVIQFQNMLEVYQESATETLNYG